MTDLLADVVALRNTVGMQQDETSNRINKLANRGQHLLENTNLPRLPVFAGTLEDKTKPIAKRCSIIKGLILVFTI